MLRHLLSVWGEVERRIHRADRLALFTDFDGTLAPIRGKPEMVRLAPRSRHRLSAIAGKGVTVGIVSGRDISDIQTKVAVRGIWYVGAHGYFVRRSGRPPLDLLTPAQKAQMVEVFARLAHDLRAVPGILLESKTATVAVHYRHGSRRDRAIALASIRALLKSYPRMRLLCGKKVWELLPASRVNKWTAIHRLLAAERRSRGERWLVFYLGDDSTDEMVFAKIKGISVVIGKRRSSTAGFFLDSTAEVQAFLAKFQATVG